MAFFLKKSTLKGRTYLSIVESYYSPQKHGGAHRTYKSLASVETWKEKGIDDPIVLNRRFNTPHNRKLY